MSPSAPPAPRRLSVLVLGAALGVAVASAGCVPLTTATTARVLPDGASVAGGTVEAARLTSRRSTMEPKAEPLGGPTAFWRRGVGNSTEVGLRASFGTAPPLLFGAAYVQGDAKLGIVENEWGAVSLDPALGLGGMAAPRLYVETEPRTHLLWLVCGHAPLLASAGGQTLTLTVSAGFSACRQQDNIEDWHEARIMPAARFTAGVQLKIGRSTLLQPEVVVARPLGGDGFQVVGGGLTVGEAR